ncbi:hypothetical protein K402DRAFT_347938 [Aulographum hederae CBS 113979]|uniref:DASH complex subunit DAD1 n=1 Tax=Aulographum hederae CBS 113979 TaxID=1176131 RepID=A0A6G1HCQ2_9PEZI|nr:hypothetical protein K402DRAFT_347938 [Aulographum hederae CBS 113979]
MSTTKIPTHNNTGAQSPTYFEQQRALLISEIAQSLESTLQNLNKLNRSLEGVIAVGNEFSSVEALWSQFENVMGHEKGEEGEEKEKTGEKEDVDAAGGYEGK